MICNNCGTDNERDFKFCVKCGSSLAPPNEVSYEQVDMGGYHSEEEYSSHNPGFSIGSGTFTINDRAPGASGSALYTADELNDTDEEFDFSMYEDLAGGGPDQETPAMSRTYRSDVYGEQESQDSKFWRFFEGGDDFYGDRRPEERDFFSKSSHNAEE